MQNINSENDLLHIRNLLKDFPRILLCSYDQGGAEVLSSWATGEKFNFDYILGDFALNIFKQKMANLSNQVTFDQINHDLLISTLGWQTNFEHEVIIKAKAGGAKSLIFLDHYGDYKGCLTRGGITQTVDWVVAFDEISRKKVIRELPRCEVFLVPNLYVKNTAERAKALKGKSSVQYQILYLTEPHQQDDAYSEFDAINFFFQTLSENQLTETKILIRIHPSEITEKYQGKVPTVFKNVTFSVGNPLECDIASSRYVVGTYTTALKVAELSGSSPYSTLVMPPITPTVPYRPLKGLVEVLSRT